MSETDALQSQPAQASSAVHRDDEIEVVPNSEHRAQDNEAPKPELAEKGSDANEEDKIEVITSNTKGHRQDRDALESAPALAWSSSSNEDKIEPTTPTSAHGAYTPNVFWGEPPIVPGRYASLRDSFNGDPPPSLITQTNFTGTNRRDNPKSLHVRRLRQAYTKQQTSSLPPPHDKPVTQAQGIGSLYRLCEAVPYLLGPQNYVETLFELPEIEVLEEALKDENGSYVLDPKSLTKMDFALAATLALLRTPTEELDEDVAQYLKTFSYKGGWLTVYKDVAPKKTPEVAPIELDGFIKMACAWKELPNPAMVQHESAMAQTPWAVIYPMLQERKINIGDLDKAIFEDLTMSAQGASLTVKLNYLESLSRSGQLAERKRKATRNGLVFSDTFHFELPKCRDRNTPYAMRFSHKHPTGKLIDYNESRRTDPLFGDRPVATPKKPAVSEGMMKFKQKRKKFARTKCGKTIKWSLIVLLVVGIIAGILVTCYFKLGQRQQRFD